jgi:hypothetical protein
VIDRSSARANVLVVETFAEDTFNWAKQLLGDAQVSADPAHAAHLVDCVASDEVAHVDYLSVALSGCVHHSSVRIEIKGSEVVDGIFRRRVRGMAPAAAPSHQVLRNPSGVGDATGRPACEPLRDLDSGWRSMTTSIDVLLLPREAAYLFDPIATRASAGGRV